ncbi:MAG TPA: hypothetical protein VN300_00185 [Desulfobacterales bacterium]|nr:hypothetical protein [Desulfobacterales bacterium]
MQFAHKITLRDGGASFAYGRARMERALSIVNHSRPAVVARCVIAVEAGMLGPLRRESANGDLRAISLVGRRLKPAFRAERLNGIAAQRVAEGGYSLRPDDQPASHLRKIRIFFNLGREPVQESLAFEHQDLAENFISVVRGRIPNDDRQFRVFAQIRHRQRADPFLDRKLMVRLLLYLARGIHIWNPLPIDHRDEKMLNLFSERYGLVQLFGVHPKSFLKHAVFGALAAPPGNDPGAPVPFRRVLVKLVAGIQFGRQPLVFHRTASAFSCFGNLTHIHLLCWTRFKPADEILPRHRTAAARCRIDRGTISRRPRRSKAATGNRCFPGSPIDIRADMTAVAP